MLEDFTANVVLGVVRGFLNRSIQRFTPQELYDAIQENRDLWTATPEDMKRQGQKIKKSYGRFYEKYSDRITTGLILQWLEQDHFLLANTIINVPNGLVWLENQISKIKREMFGTQS